MKKLVMFEVMVLSMALVVMAFNAIPVTASTNCADAFWSYGTLSGRPGWVYFSAYDVVNCPDVVWAALYVTMTVNGVEIPPTDVQSPYYDEFPATSLSGGAYVTWYCSVHGYGSSIS
ncbi:MAG: hypothetical protein ACQCN3_01365 [Candidatus Bathyarchaeia archaeon]|jgi:hypothetical protein